MTAVVAAVFAIFAAGGHPCEDRAFVLAELVVAETAQAHIDPLIVAALIVRESGCRPGAVGAAGEIGLTQIKPDAAGIRFCEDLLPRLKRPAENIRCAVRVLAWARAKCGPDPGKYVGAYQSGNCRASRYSRRVLSLLPQPK